MTQASIYLDYNATTPCDPAVVDAMSPCFSQTFANPSSVNHRQGRDAFGMVETARSDVAKLIGARTGSEIIFLAGATEANNLALKGAAEASTQRRHFVTQATEHSSVLEPLRALERRGFEVSVVGVNRDGRVDLDQLRDALRPDTLLVSTMAANSETGVVQPISEIAELAHRVGALMHCDAAQVGGKIPLDVADLDADLLSLSAHKFYGPKGVGALFVRRRRPPITLVPRLHGGGQESGLRSGTSNVPAIVGLAHALGLAVEKLDAEARRLESLRNSLERRLVDSIQGCHVNGCTARRLPNTTNISFESVEGNALLAALTRLAVSSGSACSSAHSEPSHVLLAMGVSGELAEASLRFSLGRGTTEAEIDAAAEMVSEEVHRLRELGSRRR